MGLNIPVRNTAHRACAPSCAADTGTRGGSTVISRGDALGGTGCMDCKCGSACSRTANCFDDTTADKQPQVRHCG